MKLRNYVALMVVCIVAMAFAPVAPCWAGWTYQSNEVSSGDDDYDNKSGPGYSWSWSYTLDYVDNGASSLGSWADVDITADAEVYVYALDGEAASLDITKNTAPTVFGKSYFEDVSPYDQDDLAVSWDVLASGTVSVEGVIEKDDLGYEDTVGCASQAKGEAEGHESGYGYAYGWVTESSTGYTQRGVVGEAEIDNAPTPTQTSETYLAILDFTVDAYDSDSIPGGQGNSYDAEAYMSAYAAASANLDISSGYTGWARGTGEVEFDGWAIVYVTIP